MAAERVIGVDFGTSTSVIRVKRYCDGVPTGGEWLGTEAVVFNNGAPMVPTLIQRLGDNAYFGCDAQKNKKGAVLYHSFKVDLESPDPEKRQRARELTQEFLNYLAGVYKSQSENGHLGEMDDRERTIISYPVKWGGGTKNFMKEAAGRAGFPHVEGMDEAQAAIHAVTLQNGDSLQKQGYLKAGKPCTILMIDMGAGTTDLALCRYTPGTSPVTETLATWPIGGNVLFGGREADEVLRAYARTKLPPDMAETVLSKCSPDKFKAWKEHTVSPALLKGDTVESFADLDMITELLDVEVEPWNLSRQSFEEAAGEYLKKFPALIRGCIAASGVNAAAVELVILTGGHSQWYFVKELLAGKMPAVCGELLPQITADPKRVLSAARPQETVALGLAYAPLASVPFTGTDTGADDGADDAAELAIPVAVQQNHNKKEDKAATALTDTAAAAGEKLKFPVEEDRPSSLSELAGEFIGGQDFVKPGQGDFTVSNPVLLREYLGIPAGEKLYLACDTTLLGTCRYGYAFAESGIYSRRYGGPEYVTWETFAQCDFQQFSIGEFGIGIGPLTICHTKTGEPRNALRMIEELQRYLREQGGGSLWDFHTNTATD